MGTYFNIYIDDKSIILLLLLIYGEREREVRTICKRGTYFSIVLAYLSHH